MAGKVKNQELLATLEAAALAHGLEVVDLEFSNLAGQAVVRVYLESADESGTVDIDTLAAANAWIDPLIETADPYRGTYTLEVSSPGINRTLRTRRHFERFCGSTIKLKTQPIAGRSNWTGVLTAVTPTAIELQTTERSVEIGLDQIKHAQIQADVLANGKVL
ncbi:MAG: ribosome maturation factor RimP [Actinomycetia bacterium]|nr:ribosome maturation factor RimP [Actinomycetes bacterium]